MNQPVPAGKPAFDLVFRPKARLLRILGEELISDEIIAIIELVKNAYDADASEVTIRLHLDDPSEQAIEIVDNGVGMKKSQLTGAWMQPGGSWKAERELSESGRRLLGRKGVGRFAADKLAGKLEIRTKRAGAKTEFRAEFDWDQFVQGDKFLDEVHFELHQADAEDAESHGTSLILKPLRRESWDEEMIKRLRMELIKLQLAGVTGEGSDFKIELVVGNVRHDLAEQMSDLLHKAPVIALARVQRTKEGVRILPIINGRAGSAVTAERQMGLQCGEFEVKLHVWNRNMQGTETIRQTMNFSLAEARNLLDTWAGISIYRDGFRVYPYGQVGNDWLELDKRRINRPGERISNNQIIGFVKISQANNSELRDQTNREGLIEGPAYAEFSTLVRQIIQLAANELREGKKKDDQDGKRKGKTPLFPREALEALQRRVADEASPPEPRELRALAKRVADETAEVEKAVYGRIARYNRLLSLGVVAARMAHETRQHIDVIRREADAGTRLVNRKAPGAEVSARFGTIDKAAAIITREVKSISPFIRARRKPETIDLIQAAEDVIEQHRLAIDKGGVSVSVNGPRGKLLVRADITEVLQVLHNLVDNALFWLKGVQKKSLSIVGSIKSGSAQLVVDDSGPGIPPEHEDDIFEPFWTTRSEGSGLGLPIAGEIVSELGGEIHLVRNQPGRGCAFQLSIPLVKE